jgi:hypothetical protein
MRGADYYKENAMKAARLIKRNQAHKPLCAEEQREVGPQTAAIDARKSVMRWVHEHRELRPVNARAQFAALFKSVG